ncbi:MAG: exostosin family protein [Bryobacteraceae bacterium]
MSAGDTLRVYSQLTQHGAETGAELNPVLLEAFESRAAGSPATLGGRPIERVENPADADVFALPYTWTYYVANERIEEAASIANHAEALGKKLLVWHRGDLPPLYPFRNVIACQSALYRSRHEPHEVAAPFFVEDPLPRHAGGELRLRPKPEKPVVGFWGYAQVVWPKVAYTYAANLLHNHRARRGKGLWDITPITPATLLRARVLRILAADSRLETRFHASRRAFRRIDPTGDPEWRNEQISLFYKNVLNSDYTVCVRGYGNWSIRFYETLACGRIPVFVDTDCVLPEAGVDWKRFCVHVDRNNIESLPDRILEFHERMSPEQFLARQQECRHLWETRLSRHGFLSHLAAAVRDLR